VPQRSRSIEYLVVTLAEQNLGEDRNGEEDVKAPSPKRVNCTFTNSFDPFLKEKWPRQLFILRGIVPGSKLFSKPVDQRSCTKVPARTATTAKLNIFVGQHLTVMFAHFD
jgi:hypothetical protein